MIRLLSSISLALIFEFNITFDISYILISDNILLSSSILSLLSFLNIISGLFLLKNIYFELFEFNLKFSSASFPFLSIMTPFGILKHIPSSDNSALLSTISCGISSSKFLYLFFNFFIDFLL